MPSWTRILSRGGPIHLGVDDAPLAFGRPSFNGPSSEAPLLRRLRLDGEDAFDLAYWCGTCPLVFERLEGANRTLSGDELQGRLNAGVVDLDDEVVAAASMLVSGGMYVPLLLGLRPTLVMPSASDDYFAHEQVVHRGLDSFWGLPQNPRTPYYRLASWQAAENDFVFEFVVPMLPPTWNDKARVASYEEDIRAGAMPTVLALSIIDKTQPYDSDDSHTGFIHFILDGHNKMEAAARLGAEIEVLSLLSLDDSLDRPDHIDSILDQIKRG